MLGVRNEIRKGGKDDLLCLSCFDSPAPSYLGVHQGPRATQHFIHLNQLMRRLHRFFFILYLKNK